ncbi:MAG: hypothetical protein LC776_06170 [Acidobacteria bacterium]|nr:hypothetical protein [Acidobacteriota bacterium]
MTVGELIGELSRSSPFIEVQVHRTSNGSFRGVKRAYTLGASRMDPYGGSILPLEEQDPDRFIIETG